MGRTLKPTVDNPDVPNIHRGYGVTNIPTDKIIVPLPKARESIEDNIAKMNGKDLDSFALQIGIEFEKGTKLWEKKAIVLKELDEQEEKDGLQQENAGTDEGTSQTEGSGNSGAEEEGEKSPD